eukprot:TRINITY_DN28426_c0_g1_i1.p1 TRINITY_DN28426_c0_g1~~TRINITY_DN28426_c0_g1_i1.p1  ORF type:complete len:960 (-),score=162.85 TRINITY_DN28426_c0_g1_i1:46-2679(-)
MSAPRPEIGSRPAQIGGPGVTGPPPQALAVEVSTKKPVHLAEARTKPVALLRRGTQQPRSQGRTAASRTGRVLRLGAAMRQAPLVAASPPGPGSREVAEEPKASDACVQAALDHFFQAHRPSPLGDTVVSAAAVSAAPSPRRSPGRSPVRSPRRSPMSRPTSLLAPSRSPSVASGSRRQLQASAVPSSSSSCCGGDEVRSPAHGILQRSVSPRMSAAPKARLADVVDLQLLLPESHAQVEEQKPHATRPEAACARSIASSRDEAAAPDIRGDPALPQVQEAPPARPSPPLRPVIRGLIADVIEELSAPPPYQAPAQVSGGVELAPLFGSVAPRTIGAAPRRGPAPLDEDALGRRLRVPPPPYEDGPPPAYEGPGPSALAAQEERQKQWQKRQEVLQAKEKALNDAQTEARVRLKQLEDAQKQAQQQAQALVQAQTLVQGQGQSFRDEATQLLRAVQQHADDAQKRLTEAAERQAEAMQRASLELQERLAQAVNKELSRKDSGASAPVPVPTPAAAPALSPELGLALSAVQDSIRRFEDQLERQTLETARAMSMQSEERAAFLAALADQHRAPLQVMPLAIPQQQALRPATPRQPTPRPATPRAESGTKGEQVPAAEPEHSETAVQTAPEHDELDMAARQAKIARFTDYLLQGPPGERPPPEGLGQPQYAWPQPAGTEALLALALRSHLPSRGPQSEPPGSSSSVAEASFCSELVTSSPGIAAESSAEDLASPARWRPPMGSPGELPSPGSPRHGEADGWTSSPGACAAPTQLTFLSSPGEVHSGSGKLADAYSLGEMSGSLPTSRAWGGLSSPASPASASLRGMEPGELAIFAGPSSTGEVSEGETAKVALESLGGPSSGEVSGHTSPPPPSRGTLR